MKGVQHDYVVALCVNNLDMHKLMHQMLTIISLFNLQLLSNKREYEQASTTFFCSRRFPVVYED